MRNGGAAHKNMEAPRSINRAMPESSISVTSHLRLLIPSHSSLATHLLLSNFRVQGSGLWWQLRCNIYRGDARRPEDRSHMSDV